MSLWVRPPSPLALPESRRPIALQRFLQPISRVGHLCGHRHQTKASGQMSTLPLACWAGQGAEWLASSPDKYWKVIERVSVLLWETTVCPHEPKDPMCSARAPPPPGDSLTSLFPDPDPGSSFSPQICPPHLLPGHLFRDFGQEVVLCQPSLKPSIWRPCTPRGIEGLHV